MRYFKVKLVSCESMDNIWYANKIGQEFIVKSDLKMGDKFKFTDTLYLNKLHCEIISELEMDGTVKQPPKKQRIQSEVFSKIKHYISKGKTTREVAKILKVSLATIGIAVHGNN